MKYVEVDGVRISAIGVGCWQFGSSDWGYGRDYEATAVDIVHTALDRGVNLIDTAEIYARGVSEAIVGRAIEGRRDEAFIATKMWPVMPTADKTYEHGRLSSMRIGIKTIDLYQIHWPNPLFSVTQAMAGMKRLQDDGIVRHAGVSNFNAEKWHAAEQALGRPVLSNQVQFSLVQRKPEHGVLPYAQSHDRLVIAYSPLGQGVLGGRYDASNLPKSPARLNNPLFLPENLQRVTPLIEALREIARSHDATPAQVSLAWLIRKPNVVAIPGASSIEQLEHNVAAADLELSDDEDARLTAASDAFEPVRGPAAVPGLLRARRRAS
jgi:aryl-alcohol dehydrogenase-like predicted oxidoreductase